MGALPATCRCADFRKGNKLMSGREVAKAHGINEVFAKFISRKLSADRKDTTSHFATGGNRYHTQRVVPKSNFTE